MSNFYANYPSAGEAAGGNPSVGPNNAPAPTSSTEVGFIDGGGNLQGVSSSNPLPVTLESEVGTLNVNVAQYGGTNTTLGQKASAASQPVVIASDQSTLPISAASLPLPSGASTSALQSNVQSVPGTPQTTALTIQGNASGVPVPVSGTITPSIATTFFTGQKTSTGTAVAISGSSQPLTNGVIVQALSTNMGLVYIGGSGVTSSTGFQLQPGQATSIAINNTNAVYVIAISSGDGICYAGS
jgi:hypothetical protein